MPKASNIYVAIMAGGIGSRFWPASRKARPKQFMDILGTGKSLIRLTYERFLKLCPSENIFVVTNKLYTDLVKTHLPELSDNQILREPSRNNTGPCVGYTSFKLHGLNPDANFVVSPSDHIVLKEEEFIETLKIALSFAEQNDALCTLGITPTRPDTGYGYIHFNKNGKDGIHKVLEFKEKPILKVAKEYFASGEYLWNAGIFIWNAKHILAAFEKHALDIYDILKEGKNAYNTEEEQTFIDKNYPKTPSISVDYAILERAKNVYTIPADIGWSDLGTWASLHEELDKDENGNILQGGHIISDENKNSLIRMPSKKLAVIKGLEEYIVVDEGDVLLIWPKNEEQSIKQLTRRLKDHL